MLELPRWLSLRASPELLSGEPRTSPCFPDRLDNPGEQEREGEESGRGSGIPPSEQRGPRVPLDGIPTDSRKSPDELPQGGEESLRSHSFLEVC